MKKATFLVLGLLVALTACSFQNKEEREAQKITQAVIADDPGSIKDDLPPNGGPTRVQFAEWSDELKGAGALKSLKENPKCDPGAHCFDVVFEKANYTERMQYDEKGKVSNWAFHMVDAFASPAPTH